MSEQARVSSQEIPDETSAGIFYATLEGKILRSNARFAEMIGYTPEEVGDLTLQRVTAGDDFAPGTGVLGRLSSGETDSISMEKFYLRKDGSLTRLKETLSLKRMGEAPGVQLFGLLEDVNGRKPPEAAITNEKEPPDTIEERYRVAFEVCPDAVLITRLTDGMIVDVNQAFLDITGFPREEVSARELPSLDIWADAEDSAKLLEELDKTGGCRDVEVRLRKKSGDVFWGQVSASSTDIEGVPGVIFFIQDISAAKAAEAEIKSLAFYDPLTGLPNRRLLWERLRQAMNVSTRYRCQQALLFIDLDDFKRLNDTLGHHIGDLMLQETARRIVGCIRGNDTVARLGGDEFVVILEDLNHVSEIAAAQAKNVGMKILDALGQPYMLEGRECHSTSSMGITVFGDHGESTNEVMQKADIAMYKAKAEGRNTMVFFAPELQAFVSARAELESDLRHAISKKQFSLYYQAQVDRGLLIGAEALIRWKHPLRGIVLPGDFVPLAEETGLILPMGSWVLETACAQMETWAQRKEGAHLSVTVNVSGRELHDPRFVSRVLAVLERTGANPQNLKLELTESTLLSNIDGIIAKMSELKAHGVRFSLDDFGMGHSPLAYLKRLPLDQLKIDRSFVCEVLVDPVSSALVQAIISFSKAMGLTVIAEGVETEEQREFLAGLGCHSFQGYLFSHPLPLGEF